MKNTVDKELDGPDLTLTFLLTKTPSFIKNSDLTFKPKSNEDSIRKVT